MRIAKSLLWIDCVGGLAVGVLVLTLSSWLSTLYGMPERFVIALGIANLAGPLAHSLRSGEVSPMRRLLRRSVVSLWTLWFAVITVGPGGFGACPEHGSGGHNHSAVQPAAAQSGARPVPTPVATSEPDPHADPHAGHHDHQPVASPGASTTGQAPAPPAHQCTCLGVCCMMAPSALPASNPSLVATIVAPRATPTPAYRAVLAARRILTQPYAIGPPAAPIA